MNRFIQDIIELNNIKRYFFAFIILAICFQALAFMSYGSIFWYLGDYLWYLFIIAGVVNAIFIGRRKAKLAWKDTYERRVSNYKENFLSNLKIDDQIFDVEPTDLAYINKKPIMVEGRKVHMEKMRDFLEIVRKVKEKVAENWPDDNDMSDWSFLNEDEIKDFLIIKDTDIDVVIQSKKSLKFWIEAYNSDLERLKAFDERSSETLYEEGMIALAPLILLIVVAIQLGNVTNKLLWHVYGF